MREPASPRTEGTGVSPRRPSAANAGRMGASSGRAAAVAIAVLAVAAFGTSSALAQDMAQPLPPPSAQAAPAPRAPVLTRAPVLLKEPAPVYPPDALAARLSADVK